MVTAKQYQPGLKVINPCQGADLCNRLHDLFCQDEAHYYSRSMTNHFRLMCVNESLYKVNPKCSDYLLDNLRFLFTEYNHQSFTNILQITEGICIKPTVVAQYDNSPVCIHHAKYH